MSDPVWLVQAEKYKGFHETGENRGIEQFISLAGAGSLGDAWCAIFLNAMLQSVGVHGTRSAAARSFSHSEFMRQISEPIRGCIVVLWRGSPTGELGHVGFFLAKDSRGILMLSGNDDDQVEEKYHPEDRLVGYYWPTTAPMLPPAPTIPASTDAVIFSGKGSWYSQYHGRDIWVDKGDGIWNDNKTVYLGPNNKLGVADEAQGIALFDQDTLGQWFEVQYEGHEDWHLGIQSDIGPHPKTGRSIDISAALADRMGFTRKNFPTDGIFRWRKANPPLGMENLSPQQQATQYAKGSRPPVIDQPNPPLPPSTAQPWAPQPPKFPPPAPPTSADRDRVADEIAALRELAEEMRAQRAQQPPEVKQAKWAAFTRVLGVAIKGLTIAFPQIGIWGTVALQALAWMQMIHPLPGSPAPTNTTMALTTMLGALASGLVSRIGRRGNVTEGNGKN